MRRTIFGVALVVCGGLGFAAGRTTLLNTGTAVTPKAAPAMILASLIDQPDDMAMDEGMIRAMELGAPNENHKALESLIGEWEGFVRFQMSPDAEPMEMPGEVSREWILGGRFVQEDVTSESEFGYFEAIGIVGYNNFDGVYESAWIENMSTAIMSSHGYYEADKKIFHFSESHRNPMTGKIVISKSTLDVSNPDRHVMRGTMPGPDGTPFEHFYGVFKRVN